MKKILLLSILFITGLSLISPCQVQGQDSQGRPVSRVVEDGGTGPYSAIMLSESTLPTHTVFRPVDLTPFGAKNKLPVLAWGNGGCANSPGGHINFLSEVSSYGFLVIAIGPMPQEGERNMGGSQSSQLIDAINWAIAQNSDKSSPYYNKIDVTKIAVAGMSCGGLQALETAPDPRVSTVMVCNSGIVNSPGARPAGAPPAGAPGARPAGAPPVGGGMPALTKDYLAKVHSPVLYLLGGESDIAYANGMDDFERLNHVPVFVANMDVGHGGTYSKPHGGEFAKVATSWLLWQLKGDKKAGKLFKGKSFGLSKDPNWKVEKKNIK